MNKRLLSRIASILLSFCLLAALPLSFALAQTIQTIEGEPIPPGDTITSSLGYQITYPSDLFRYLPQMDGDVFWADVTALPDVPNVYLSVSWLQNQTLFSAQEGLLLQSGLSGAWENASLSGTNAAVLRVQEGDLPNSRVCVYTLYPAAPNRLLLVEYAYFLEAEEGFGARLSAMRDSITLTGGGVSQDARVECQNCGLFFPPDEIDEHVCVGK